MMSDRVTEYLSVYKDILLRYEDEEKWYGRLDVLYREMDNHEIEMVEVEVGKFKPTSAPISLDLMDVPVVVGESILPRIKVEK